MLSFYIFASSSCEMQTEPGLSDEYSASNDIKMGEICLVLVVFVLLAVPAQLNTVDSDNGDDDGVLLLGTRGRA